MRLDESVPLISVRSHNVRIDSLDEMLKSLSDQDGSPIASSPLAKRWALRRPRRTADTIKLSLVEMPFNMIAYFGNASSLDMIRAPACIPDKILEATAKHVLPGGEPWLVAAQALHKGQLWMTPTTGRKSVNERPQARITVWIVLLEALMLRVSAEMMDILRVRDDYVARVADHEDGAKAEFLQDREQRGMAPKMRGRVLSRLDTTKHGSHGAPI
jgi:hypothetical protein